MSNNVPNAAESNSGEETTLSVEEEIAQAQAEYEDYKQRMEEAIQSVRDLRAEEDFKKGIFKATEIHAMQQEKLRLEVEMEFRRKKINRLRLNQ